MDTSFLDLEFFDFSNTTEDEVKNIQELLKPIDGVSYVELPWSVQAIDELNSTCKTEIQDELVSEESVSENPQSVPITEETLIYNSPPPLTPPTPPPPPPSPPPPPPPPPLAPPALTNPDLLSVGTFVPPPGVTLPAVTTVGQFPSPQPYFIPRTLPYLRAYPHLGLPLFTCSVPGGGDMCELAPLQTTGYGHILPIPAVVQPLEKTVDMKGESLQVTDNRQKIRTPTDRQYNRRNKKKHIPCSGYYNSTDVGSAVETYHQGAVMTEEHMSVPLQTPVDIGGEQLTSVASSIPFVPFSVPPSTFAVTSGALPLPAYPPGLHTLPYSHISGPQTASAPVFYVPVFNPPYASYIPSPTSASLVVPVETGEEIIHPVNGSGCVPEDQLTAGQSVDSVSGSKNVQTLPEASTQNFDLSSKSQGPCETLSIQLQQHNDNLNSSSESPEQENLSAAKPSETNNSNFSTVSGNGCKDAINDVTVDSINKVKLGDGEICAEQTKPRNIEQDGPLTDSARSWADLFKKQCASSELNGLDQETDVALDDDNEQISSKGAKNGDSHSVPATQDIH